MVNLKSIFFVLHFQLVIIIYTGCLEWFTSICNTSEESEGYSTQCSYNGISLLEMYEDGDKYKFTFDDSYAQEKDNLRIGFSDTKGDTLEGVFLTWGSQKRPPREVKNGELLTSIKRTLFTYKNKGVYSMCLKKNTDCDYNDINEVIIVIYIENESDCRASFIIDDKGVNVYTEKCSPGSSNVVGSKHVGESVSVHSSTLPKREKFLNDTMEDNSLQINDDKKESNSHFNDEKKESSSQFNDEKKESSSQIKGEGEEYNPQFNDEKKESSSRIKGEGEEYNPQFNDEKKESNSQFKGEGEEYNSKIKNCKQTQESQNKGICGEYNFQFSEDNGIESIMADERILKIFENDESIEPRNQGEECDWMLKHLKITSDIKEEKEDKESNEENENVEKKENKDNFLEKVKDKITYSNKKVSVCDDIDPNSLVRLKSIVDNLQIYFETEDGKVIDEHIFKSFSKGPIKSGDFIRKIKTSFLTSKKNNSFFMCPINRGGTRKCRIKITQWKTRNFFYLINADNKEQPHIFFY